METRFVKLESSRKEEYKVFGDDYDRLKFNNQSVIVNNGKEDEFILVPEELIGEFTISILMKSDLEKYNISEMSKDDFRDFANKINHLLMEGYFYEFIDNVATEFCLEEKEDNLDQ